MDNNVFRIINKKTKEWRDMTSVEKYEYQIEENINVYFSGKGPYRDPDYWTERKEDGFRVKTDGILSYKEIERLGKKYHFDPICMYSFVRKNMYDCLVWPVHSNSINQLKGIRLDDRLDKTLCEIKKFYYIVNDSAADTDLKLSKAFKYQETRKWLESYNTFNTFVDKRNLKLFVEPEMDQNGDYIVADWTEGIIPDNCSFPVTEPYYAQLLFRIEKYKHPERD